MKKSLLRNYAKLIARVGGNVQKGQRVVISAQRDQPEFICMLAEECCRAGAEDVTVEWQCQPLEKLASRFESVKELSYVSPWEEEKLKERAQRLPVTIRYSVPSPAATTIRIKGARIRICPMPSPASSLAQ